MAKPRVRQCLRCELPLTPELYNQPEPVPCPRCALPFLGRVYPATLRTPTGSAGEALTSAELSSCFFHPAKKAEVACEQCGRFLCALCDLEVEGKHLCPTCLEAGLKKQSMATFRTGVTRWDNVAFLLTVVTPLTVAGIYFTMFTAAAALFIAAWKWNSPRERLVARGRGRMIVSALLATGQLVGWAMLLYFILRRRY